MGNVFGMIKSKDETRIQYYSSSHKILLVGDGDFSFSLSLAKAFCSAKNMVATSLDSQGFISGDYKKALSNISELQMRGCRVMHCIDATNMAQHIGYFSNNTHTKKADISWVTLTGRNIYTSPKLIFFIYELQQK